MKFVGPGPIGVAPEVADEWVKELLRSKGLCGYVTDGHACINVIDHNDGVHREGWTVRMRFEPHPHSRSGRQGDTYYDVVEAGDRKFTTDNLQHAEWLADTLMTLDKNAGAKGA